MAAGIKVLRNCASILTGNFLNKIVSIAMLVLITGYLSPADFGRYSFVIAYVAFFGTFTELGLNTIITRDIARSGTDAGTIFGHAILLRLLLTVLALFTSFLALYLLGYPFAVIELAGAASLSLFLSFRGLFLRTVFDIPFQVNLKMSYPAAINFLNEILILAGIAALIYFKASLFWLVAVMSLLNLPGFLVSAWLSLRIIKPEFSIDPNAWLSLLKESLPLGLSALLEGLFVITPVFLLSRLSTEEAIGLFALPFRVSASLWIIPVALMVSMLPKMSRDSVSGLKLLKSGFERGLKAVLIAGVPLAFITCDYAKEAVELLSGVQYAGSVPVLKLLIWGTVLYFLNTVFLYTFTAAGMQRFNMASWALVSVLFAISSAAFIPVYLQTGAALGFVISLAAGSALNVLFAVLRLGINPVPLLAKFALSAFAGGAAYLAMRGIPGAASVSGVTVYFIALFSLKAFSLREGAAWLGRGGETGLEGVSRPE